MQRINLYPSPLTPLVNDGTGDITHGDYDVAIDLLALISLGVAA